MEAAIDTLCEQTIEQLLSDIKRAAVGRDDKISMRPTCFIAQESMLREVGNGDVAAGYAIARRICEEAAKR